jgi:probable addiction module antidote protein
MKTKKFKVMEYNDSDLIKRLRKNSKELEEYIDYVCEEYAKDQNLAVLLESLKVAVMAKRGMATKIAKKGKIERTNIYKALSKNVNPRIDTLQEIIKAFGRYLVIQKVYNNSYDRTSKCHA